MTAVAVDVTQFSRQPARTGVQRMLAEMARAWPTDAETVFVARVADHLQAVSSGEFAAIVDAHFAARGPAIGPEQVRAGFSRGRRVRPAQLDEAAWLLPEPTYDLEVLDDLHRRGAAGQRVGAVVHDCFPQTHPWAFAGNGQAPTSPYFRFLGQVPLAVATSDDVASTLTGRLRRDPARTPVSWLGTDHVQARPSGGRRAAADLLVVGTVEPRKRFELALAAVERLRESVPPARLVVVGRPGWAEPSFLRRLRRLSDEGSVVDWRSDADDDELEGLLRSATALLVVGDEGYGLPVVEAAQRGCPVLYGGVQPAASLLDGRGAWRVDSSSPDALARELAPWCDPDFATAQRAQIDVAGLPTWRAFSAEVQRQLLESSR
jgi:glycosyltransferase involved in cell wall biosynthesis